MDRTERKMTKIAREVSKFTVQTMKADGIGTAEFDFIHLVRHNPGITQTQVREELQIDKGAAARRASSLEAKGYLIRKPNPKDGRSQLLYATEQAEHLKNSKARIETFFYDWLLEELPEAEKEQFCKTLDTLYRRSKQERQARFVHVAERVHRADEPEARPGSAHVSGEAEARPGFVHMTGEAKTQADVLKNAVQSGTRTESRESAEQPVNREKVQADE